MMYSWTSIQDELPPSEEEVLAFVSHPDLKDFSYNVMIYDADANVWRESQGRRTSRHVTHWMLLSPPEDVFTQDKGEPITEPRPNRRESDRNKDIVCWLLEGRSPREISEMYDLSIGRVRLIIKRVIKKIAPGMVLSTREMRRIREHLISKIRDEL
ncbi:MAG: DUF551 domain-containing protein [Desulfococcus multivorans]|uniref:DUF551 domain-containing protein n=1 Tax=Desulfococcus sp. TaxID=2025834 RepID=UPI002A3A87A1|nr:DUF551 domain-containing protein [Desulfococcus multivorans]